MTQEHEHAHTRRREDPYRELIDRIVTLERDVAGMKVEVTMVKQEQRHMGELFAARFTTLEKAQELAISELRSLNKNLHDWSSEPDKSPSGRALLSELTELRGEMRTVHTLEQRCNRFEGAIGLIQWIGFGSLIAIALGFGKVMGWL